MPGIESRRYCLFVSHEIAKKNLRGQTGLTRNFFFSFSYEAHFSCCRLAKVEHWRPFVGKDMGQKCIGCWGFISKHLPSFHSSSPSL